MMAVAIPLSWIGISEASGQAGKQETPAIKAARARQDAVKTMDIKFKKIEWVAKGGRSTRSPRLLTQFKLKAVLPEKETTLESVHRFVISEEKFRYEHNHPNWVMPTGELVQKQVICVFNGSIAKVFYPVGVAGKGNLQGNIAKDARLDHIRVIELQPLLLHFRGLHPLFSGALIEELKPSAITLPIDGSTCHEYVRTLSEKAVGSYWLDPQKDQVIRRIQLQSGGRLVDQIDVNYRRDETYGWVPASWVCNEYSAEGNALLATTKMEVLQLRVNEVQPAGQFEMLFPPETRVYDAQSNKYYRVQPDGTMRELSRKGVELPGAIAQPGDSWYRRNRWFLVSLGIAPLLLGLAYALRSRNKDNLSR